MDYRFAKTLHNDDEVTIIETKEVVKVINTEVLEKDVFVYTMTSHGYTKLHHTEIS